MPESKIDSTVKQKHGSRYRKILGVLIKYGFQDMVAHPPLNRLYGLTEKLAPHIDGKSVLDYTRYERIRMVCEELGTTFIKFAQIASNRPDLLPEELIAELTTFQDQTKTLDEATIRGVLKLEYAKPWEEYFADINFKPLASASMSQVHRARTRSGDEVVLKIQRPNIQKDIESDIAILMNLAEVVEKNLPQYKAYQPVELVKMFDRAIHKELNFQSEAANLKRFSENFQAHPDIYVPKVFLEFSTKRLLCMEFIDGYKITDLEKIKASSGLTGPDLAKKGIGLYFEQVFNHGFFHADPHPGNIFVLKNTGQICFIDYGMMGHVLEEDQENISDLLLSLSVKDIKALKKALMRFSVDGVLYKEKELDQDLLEFMAVYSNMELDNIDSSEVIKGLNSLFFDYKIQIPSNLLLLMKAMIIIEGVGLEIDPKYNIIENIEPFARNLFLRKFSPTRLKRDAITHFVEMSRYAKELPEDLRDITKKVKEGRLHVEFEHKGLEPMMENADTIANRVSFTILIAALVIGSSLIVVADVPPFVYNISAIGFFGFIIAGLLTARLIYSIIRHGNF
ncbi:MAG: hypothetical protein HKN16_07340 [Saprospiraceae bacterium]|nr:hypothetical protein [Saprospiraceae bacterium]